MIRVVVTGSECTGKTTLSRALAEHYATVCAPEYARQFVAEKGAAPEYGDVDAIARGQIESEDRLLAEASRVIVQDTDLLSTVIYSRHYYGDCPGWIDEALSQRAANLYVLAAIDIPWAADGDQRDRGDRREEMQELFRSALTERGLPFVEARGEVEERVAAAVLAIDALLNADD